MSEETTTETVSSSEPIPPETQKRIEAGIAEYHTQVAVNKRLLDELSLAKRDYELSRLECDSLKRALEDAQSTRLRDIEEGKRDITTLQGKLDSTGHRLAQYEVLFGLVFNALQEFKRETPEELPPNPKPQPRDPQEARRNGLRAVEGALAAKK
jgi:hypothetical protein